MRWDEMWAGGCLWWITWPKRGAAASLSLPEKLTSVWPDPVEQIQGSGEGIGMVMVMRGWILAAISGFGQGQ